MKKTNWDLFDARVWDINLAVALRLGWTPVTREKVVPLTGVRYEERRWRGPHASSGRLVTTSGVPNYAGYRTDLQAAWRAMSKDQQSVAARRLCTTMGVRRLSLTGVAALMGAPPAKITEAMAFALGVWRPHNPDCGRILDEAVGITRPSE